MRASFRHNLIIFYGSSPGAGKSTLSSFLYEQLQLHSIPIRWIYEDDVLHLKEFQAFVKDIQGGNPALIHSLLDASTEFIEQQKDSNEVLVTDSIFPCSNWLIATGFYTHEQMNDFGNQLEQILRPLNPLVIYLNIEPSISLRRAVQQRGQKWLEDTLVGMNGYGHNQDRPLQGFDDVAAYFKMVGDLSLEWLKEWESDLLVLDAISRNIPELQKTILYRLGLQVIEPPKKIETSSLQALVGTYKCKDKSTTLDQQLMFEVIDGVLRVDSYWPSGCELIAVGVNTFRLRETSREIRFGQFQDGIPQEVVYNNQRESYRYIRIR